MIDLKLLERLMGEMAGGKVEIAPENKLNESGLDSLDMLQLLQEIEKVTETQISIGKINGNMTFSELIAAVNKE